MSYNSVSNGNALLVGCNVRLTNFTVSRLGHRKAVWLGWRKALGIKTRVAQWLRIRASYTTAGFTRLITL